jgi:peroxiredoxin Q/BCP
MTSRSLAVAFIILTISAIAHGGDMLDAGTTFPTFELTAHDGSTVTNATLAGHHALIYFYPKADTPGCTKEACTLRDAWSDLEDAGVLVFGVSYDTPGSNKAFAEKYRLPFKLLSDTERELAKAVGADRMLLPVPKRISYLVAPDGTVATAYPSVKPAGHAEEVLADVRALQGK